MKKKLVLFSLFACLFVNNKSNAQTLGCGTAPASPNNARPLLSCPSTSTAYTTRYGRVSGYVPDANTPVKTIKIAFHFFQKANGTNNYHDTPTDKDRIRQIVAWMNARMGYIADPSDPIAGVSMIRNTTVQYELDERMYFYHDSASEALNTLATCESTPFENYVLAHNPSSLNNILPIYVAAGYYPCGTNVAGFAVFPSETDLTLKHFVVTFFGAFAEAGNGDFAFNMHLLHELGHNEDQSHTYDSNQYKLDADYLADVYNTTWWNYCSPPANYACVHDKGGDPWNTSLHSTNNIMGGSSNSEYLSPLQMGSINRALALKSLRRYVKPMTSSTNNWVVSTNETWDFNIQTYQNISVSSGATLTITCKVYMANAGKITVQSGGTLVVDGGTLSSWGDMWTGIELEAGSTLTVKNNSLIENAEIAINSKDGAAFTVQDSKLNKNYKGIRMQTYGGTHPGVIKNSTISCLDNSNNPVNLSLAPHVGERAYCAVQVDNVIQAKVGLDASGQTNTFDNLEMGIVSNNSGLTVFNNLFKRINYASDNTRGRAIESTGNSSEKSLWVGGVLNNYQSNTFQDSYVGVYATINQDVNVIYNIFTNLNTGVSVNNCSTSGNVVNVVSNTINDCNTGVYSSGNGGSTTLEVSSNLINPTGIAKPNSKAISITNPSLSTSGTAPTLGVENNTIKNSSTGVEIINFTAPNVKDNTITTSDLGSSYFVHGIMVQGSPYANIEHNLVKGPSAGSQNSWWLAGIRLESSPNSKMIYNGAEDIGRGLFLGGSSAGSQVAKNNMKNNHEGIMLNWALIGYQLGSSGACKAAENTWQGTVPSGCYNIYSYYSDGTQSPMNILLNTNPAWTSDMKTPGTIVNGASATTGGYSAVTLLSCNTTSGYTGSHRREIQQAVSREQVLALANDKITFPGNDAAGKWWAKYNLYNQLQTEPALQNEESGLKTFADNFKSDNIGKLYTLNQLIEKGAYAAAKNNLADFTAGNDIESYLKEVYIILLADKENNTLSDAEINSLQKIAKLCPYESGPAVYAARVLLSEVDPSVYFNACELPGPVDRIPAGTDGLSASENDQVIIYPNPASDRLNMAIHLKAGQKGRLRVYDVTGKLLMTEQINENTAEVSISSLSEGMYLYNVTVNEVNIRSGKLSIIR